MSASCYNMVRDTILMCSKLTSCCEKRIKDIDKLRACILTAWDEMDQHIIDAAIRQWRTGLRACIKAKGRQFELTLSQ